MRQDGNSLKLQQDCLNHLTGISEITDTNRYHRLGIARTRGEIAIAEGPASMRANQCIPAGLLCLILCVADATAQEIAPTFPGQILSEPGFVPPHPDAIGQTHSGHDGLNASSPPPHPVVEPATIEPVFTDWEKVPVYTKVPWSGWFTTVSGGPGYYTLQEQWEDCYRSKPPPSPFGTSASNQTPSYDYNFKYLDDPHNNYHMWSDAYKRMIWHEDWLVSFGGEYRYRYNHYGNSQLTQLTDSYGFSRLRAYADIAYHDRFRFFMELIDARTVDESFPLAGGIETGTDILNGFTEWKLDEIGHTPLQLRVGRQEVVMGSQRLIASPDFSNTLRTYDGVRGYWHEGSWNVDLFWIRPIIPNPDRLDSSDNNRSLSGLFLNRSPSKNALVELYLFNLNDTRLASSGDTVTLGTRVAGDVQTQLLYEVEVMTQFGSREGKRINAYSATTGLGWQFVDLPWNISFWTYFDYASGTRDPGSDRYQTFNQLFPAGHTYFGYLDLVGRQNIQDLNFQLQWFPQKWLQLRTQYHIFHLASNRDALYNSGGVPIRHDATGAAGGDVGKEIDVTMDVHLTPHQNLLFGYSRLFTGRFIKETGPGGDPDYAYAQYDIRW